MPSKQSVRILDADGIQRAITRIAHEILERNKNLVGLSLIGIRTRGVPLADRLAGQLGKVVGQTPPTGILDINLYRDDLSLTADQPVLKSTEIPFKVGGSKIVLVDDVLFTGRTIRAALDGLVDLGRPDWIQLAVLIDRGHREVPIRADYVGKNVPTARTEQIDVRLRETDGADEVMLIHEPGVEAAPAAEEDEGTGKGESKDKGKSKGKSKSESKDKGKSKGESEDKGKSKRKGSKGDEKGKGR